MELDSTVITAALGAAGIVGTLAAARMQARAGHIQAEATRIGALTQMQRVGRRDAYAAFLTAADNLDRVAQQHNDAGPFGPDIGTTPPAMAAWRKLTAHLVEVELEGPETLSTIAHEVRDACHELLLALADLAPIRQAQAARDEVFDTSIDSIRRAEAGFRISQTLHTAAAESRIADMVRTPPEARPPQTSNIVTRAANQYDTAKFQTEMQSAAHRAETLKSLLAEVEALQAAREQLNEGSLSTAEFEQAVEEKTERIEGHLGLYALDRDHVMALVRDAAYDAGTKAEARVEAARSALRGPYRAFVRAAAEVLNADPAPERRWPRRRSAGS
ncbi:hypothetical protein AB0H07_40435 [Streptomyces sp. NPDC021354]|uniref:hypothetical protein n=1 Tax=Streptomyces sp. NPDC021354 TaxID=3154793 RepID=UPI00340CC5BA